MAGRWCVAVTVVGVTQGFRTGMRMCVLCQSYQRFCAAALVVEVMCAIQRVAAAAMLCVDVLRSQQVSGGALLVHPRLGPLTRLRGQWSSSAAGVLRFMVLQNQ